MSVERSGPFGDDNSSVAVCSAGATVFVSKMGGVVGKLSADLGMVGIKVGIPTCKTETGSQPVTMFPRKNDNKRRINKKYDDLRIGIKNQAIWLYFFNKNSISGISAATCRKISKAVVVKSSTREVSTEFPVSASSSNLMMFPRSPLARLAHRESAESRSSREASIWRNSTCLVDTTHLL
jgi:hypothetical protein